MALFSKEVGSATSALRPIVSESLLTFIAPDVKIIGDIESSGVMKIEGSIEGTIRGARQVLLGPEGVVHGNIRANEAIIGGRVDGTIVAEERVELQGTSSINGDIHSRVIVVLEGAKVNGAVHMGGAPSMQHNNDTKAPQVAVVR